LGIQFFDVAAATSQEAKESARCVVIVATSGRNNFMVVSFVSNLFSPVPNALRAKNAWWGVNSEIGISGTNRSLNEPRHSVGVAR
jgi:hypothetical protein